RADRMGRRELPRRELLRHAKVRDRGVVARVQGDGGVEAHVVEVIPDLWNELLAAAEVQRRLRRRRAGDREQPEGERERDDELGRCARHDERHPNNHGAPERQPQASWETGCASSGREPRTSARNLPVWEAGLAATCSGGPVTTTSPPASPPSGPRSITQSAVLITSRLCSITRTVLPVLT